MKKIIILSILAFTCCTVVSYTGCVMKKKTKAEYINKSNHEEFTSTKRNKVDSSIAKTSNDSISTYYSNSLNESTKYLDLNNFYYLKEKAETPIQVKGELFRTSIEANWILDTSSTAQKNIVYFDLDNPSLKAKIFSDTNGKMQIEIQTKDRIYNVPIDKVSFHSSKTLQKDGTAEYSKEISKKEISSTTIKSGTKKIIIDSVNTKKSDSKIKSKEIKMQRVATHWILICLTIVLIILFLLSRKYKIATRVHNLINKIIK